MEGRLSPTIAEQAALFRVLQDCNDGHESFPERLLEALERHLNLRHSVCFAGASAPEALITSAAAARGRARPMCGPYLERYAEHDIFRTPAAERRLHLQGSVALWEFGDADVSNCRLYFDDFLRRFGMPWVFGVKIESVGHEPLFVSVLSFDGHVPQKDMETLLLLRRLLGPQLAASLRFGNSVAPAMTAREREIAEFIKSGYSNEAIASALGVKADTVKKHLTAMFHTYGVRSRTQLALALHSGTR